MYPYSLYILTCILLVDDYLIKGLCERVILYGELAVEDPKKYKRAFHSLAESFFALIQFAKSFALVPFDEWLWLGIIYIMLCTNTLLCRVEPLMTRIVYLHTSDHAAG